MISIKLYKFRTYALACLVTTFLVNGNVQAQCVTEKLIASDAYQEDIFSRSVAIDGNRLIVGASRNDDNGYSSGAAYVFKRQGNHWIEEQKLLAYDAKAYDEFGFSVDISGDIAIVGAWKSDQGSINNGAAYIFRYFSAADEWILLQKLLAPDGFEEARFGFSVSISSNLAVIGAPYQYYNPSFRGAAYAFDLNSVTQLWDYRSKLLSSATSYGDDLFGVSVDICGDIVIVGARGVDANGEDSGAAYAFRKGVNEIDMLWLEQSVLTPQDGDAGDRFGVSVAISGDNVVVGATRDTNMLGMNAGAAYLFHYDSVNEQWLEECKLLPFDGFAHDHFGRVAIEDDVIIVGAPEHDLPSYGNGAAYVYRYSIKSQSWLSHGKLLANDLDWQHGIGARVAISNGIGIVSDQYNGEAGNTAGAAHIFDVLDNEDINGNGIIDSCEIGFADLNSDGITNESDLLILLGFWGPCPYPPIECQADLFSDGIVNTQDLLVLLANWG
ncbi:MAG: FG-GAP repeat protein [Planctomycetes bacterium]|nr:FG-GAP repeat protein [Planctomycetota bacterium]